MANYPNVIDSFANPSGSSTLDSPDHALDHRNLGSAIIAIENTLGTTAGTGVISSFLLGQTAIPIKSGTIGTTIANGTFTGGVFNNLTFGTPTVQGSVVGTSVINTTNITDAAVIERKMKMDLLAGTTLTSGTTASASLVGIVGGSVTIVLPIASNVMIYFSAWTSATGGGNPLYALYLDGVKDSIWVDTIGAYNPIINSFTAWRTGIAAGTHTWQMQWRVAAGTVSLSAFELIVQPFSQ